MNESQIKYLQTLLEDAATVIFNNLYCDWNNSNTLLTFEEWCHTELLQVDELRKAASDLEHLP